jgi:hypothetical protein
MSEDADPALSLGRLAALIAEQNLPPVDMWNPERCGPSDMRIGRDGTWYYQGSPIGRPAMVKLFSTVLRREPDGGYVLVTPVEKLDIEVEDAPFIATLMTSEGEGRTRRVGFTLNTGDAVIAGPDNRLWVEQGDGGEPRPYVHVRRGLDALIARPVYYELAEIAIAEGGDPVGVWSGGEYFRLSPTP